MKKNIKLVASFILLTVTLTLAYNNCESHPSASTAPSSPTVDGTDGGTTIPPVDEVPDKISLGSRICAQWKTPPPGVIFHNVFTGMRGNTHNCNWILTRPSLIKGELEIDVATADQMQNWREYYKTMLPVVIEAGCLVKDFSPGSNPHCKPGKIYICADQSSEHFNFEAFFECDDRTVVFSGKGPSSYPIEDGLVDKVSSLSIK